MRGWRRRRPPRIPATPGRVRSAGGCRSRRRSPGPAAAESVPRGPGQSFTGTKLTRRKSMVGQFVGIAIARRPPRVALRSVKDRLLERQAVPSRSEGRQWAPLARGQKGLNRRAVPSQSGGRQRAGSRFTGTKLTRRKSMVGQFVGIAIARRPPRVALRSVKEAYAFRSKAVPSRSEDRQWASLLTGTKPTRRKSMRGRRVGTAIARRRPIVDLRSAKDRVLESQTVPSRGEGRQWASDQFTGTKLTRRKPRPAFRLRHEIRNPRPQGLDAICRIYTTD
jgi:hypothetical protein